MSGYGNFASVYDQLITGVDYRQIGEYFDACIRKAGGGKGILLDLGLRDRQPSMVMDELGYDVIGVDGSYEMPGGGDGEAGTVRPGISSTSPRT